MIIGVVCFIPSYAEHFHNLFFDNESLLYFRPCGRDTGLALLSCSSRYLPIASGTSYPQEVYAIPETVTYNNQYFDVIGTDDDIFNYSFLRKIIFPESLQFIGDNCFQDTALKLIKFSEGLLSIGECCFCGLRDVYEIEFPQSLYKIGANSFSNSEIEYIVLGEGLSIIGEGSFCKNDNLKEIKLPEALRFSGGNFSDNGLRGIFNDNKSLRYVELGYGSLSATMRDCFNGCPEIESIICLSAEPAPFEKCFDMVNKKRSQLIVPYGAKQVYSKTAGWKEFENIDELPESGNSSMRIDNGTSEPEYFTLEGLKINNPESLQRGTILIKAESYESGKILME